MAKLFGREWSRRELESYVGDFSQIAGIRLSELAEGRFWQNGKATPAMFRIVAAALVLLLSASLPASADAKRVALVIGMSDYHA